jgi:hypothetical protein
MSHESNEPIVKWTDNKTLFTGAFPNKFLFGRGIPNRLPTQQNWKHVPLYYDGQFNILYSLLTVSINCRVHVAFVTRLESPEKTWLLCKVLVCWQIQRNFEDN